MEASLLVVTMSPTPAHRDLLVQLLARDTRPIFEDEVAPDERSFYAAVEHIDYPEWIAPDGDRALQTSWLFGGDFEEDMRYVLTSLAKAGISIGHAYISEDDYAAIIPITSGKPHFPGKRIRRAEMDKWESDEQIFANLADLNTCVELG